MQHLNVIVVVIVLIVTVSAQNKYTYIGLNRIAKIERPQIVLNLQSYRRLYSFFPLVKDVLEFQVKADNDILVCLTPSYSFVEPRYYEIFIGGMDNSKSTLAKDAEHNFLAIHEGAVIERGKFNKFWIRIIKDQGVIEVGKDEIYSIPFLRGFDANFVEMQYFGVSSLSNAAAVWTMDKDILVAYP